MITIAKRKQNLDDNVFLKPQIRRKVVKGSERRTHSDGERRKVSTKSLRGDLSWR
jgi:hypothetical protein